MSTTARTMTRRRRDPLAIAAGVLVVFVGVLLGSLAGWFAADYFPKLRHFAEGIRLGNYDSIAVAGGVIGLVFGLVAGYFLSYRLSRR